SFSYSNWLLSVYTLSLHDALPISLAGAIASNFVVSNLFGIRHALAIQYNYSFPISLYWHLLILGILLGLLGHLYKVGLFSLKKVYAKITILPRWLHGLIPLEI